ncbi:hypothetical protein EYF80_038897 [Liparis tanakae]|uniref:Uncharacterized protein n=1 Tax=Liparis tanakae TaxID=230148 RepID=A0A4Z2GBE8_9TELE|nr:hypothetical protein EYF80_038897 [Liparis tanakae]
MGVEEVVRRMGKLTENTNPIRNMAPDVEHARNTGVPAGRRVAAPEPPAALLRSRGMEFTGK